MKRRRPFHNSHFNRRNAPRRGTTKTKPIMNILKIKRGGAIALAMLTLCAFIPELRAQTPTFAAQTLINTNIAAGTLVVFTNPPLIDCGKQGNVAIQDIVNWGTGGGGAATNETFFLAPTITAGGTYDSNNLKSVIIPSTVTAAGGTNVIVTNITTAGIKGYYLIAITNASSTGVASNQFTYGIKISAP